MNRKMTPEKAHIIIEKAIALSIANDGEMVTVPTHPMLVKAAAAMAGSHEDDEIFAGLIESGENDGCCWCLRLITRKLFTDLQAAANIETA